MYYKKLFKEIHIADDEGKEAAMVETDQDSHTEDNARNWDELLSQLARIPADDPGWDGQSFEYFMDAARKIGQAKSDELVQTHKNEKLASLLTESQENVLGWASYFQVKGVDLWSSDHVQPAHIEQTMQDLEALLQDLESYEHLNNQPRPGTRSERLELEEKMRSAEDAIIKKYQALHARLTKDIQVEIPEEAEEEPSDETLSSEAPPEAEPGKGTGMDISPEGDDDDRPVESGEDEGADELEKERSPDFPEPEREVELVDEKEPGEEASGVEDEAEPAADVQAEQETAPAASKQGSMEGDDVLQHQAVAIPDVGVELVETEEDDTAEVDLPELEDEPEPDESVDDGPSPAPVAPEKMAATSDEVDVQAANESALNYLENNRLPLAFWIAWGLERGKFDSSTPSWLISAAQGALWHCVLWPKPNQAEAFLNSVFAAVKPGERVWDQQPSHCQWLSLFVAIYYSLADPGNGWENWLEAPELRKTPRLNELIQEVRGTSRIGLRLDPVKVQLVVNADAVDQQIQALAQEAKQWLQQAHTRGARILRAAQVWQNLVREPGGELFKLIEPVAADHRSQASDVLERIKPWQDRTWVDKRIQKIDREITKSKKRPIVGGARDQIIGWINDICDIAETWGQAVQKSEAASQGKDWTLTKLQELCEKLEGLIPDVRFELDELKKNSKGLDAASIEISDRILQALYSIITRDDVSQLPNDWPRLPYAEKMGDMHLQTGLYDRLAYTLLFYPELHLQDDGQPDPEGSSELVTVLCTTPEQSEEDAINGWLSAHDYRFLPRILSQVSDQDLWGTRIREALRSDLQRLEQKEIDESKIATEQALLEGLIAEEEYTDYRSRIESIRKQVHMIKAGEVAGPYIRGLSLRLQSVENELAGKREVRLNALSAHWDELRQQLPNFVRDDETLIGKIEDVVDRSLSQQDLRSTWEYLAHLDGVITGGGALVPTMFDSHPVDDSDIVLKYQSQLPKLVDVLEESKSKMSLARIRDNISRGKSIPGFPIPPRMPRPRLEEASRALDAWRRLKGDGLNATTENLAHVATLMNYLGFALSEHSPVSLQAQINSLRNFQHWRVTASSGGFSPVAQFGSQREGFFDVVGVWERPGIEIIGSQVNTLMKHTGNRPTILFYFGRLVPKLREELLSVTHKDTLPMLVVDETLILFLVREYDTRLKPMFYCTLPYAAVNPYFPAAAGLVPPEVFKGRDDSVSRLIDPFDSAIVYGGRQLGKSALLRQVQREFHRPENGQFVIYEDIKSVGDPAGGKNYEADLRDRLAMALVRLKLLDSKRARAEFDRLLNYLQQRISEDGYRVLLLLDEADYFLDADADKNFNVVQKLKNLMDQTGRRFKVILAGLHNVQRFQRISNQPLAHLGRPIEIGPLEPEAAFDLLVQPLHALGYRFGHDPKSEDISLVLHILSYTNYHPGLIQLFGSYLVDHLRKKYQRPTRLPLSITRDDVEAVYRNREVREAIYERFNWTLALDSRYEVITLALILEQWDDQNGFDRLYTPIEMRDIGAEYWPEAFSAEIAPEFKGILEEMRGLGVLSGSQDGNYYRLRSPNLVYLMGTYDQIIDRLEYLSQSTPAGERALESYHARLDKGVFSPLAFSQERLLNNQRSGVALVFGSNASGLRRLDQALQRLLPDRGGAWTEIRIAAKNGQAIEQQLKSFVNKNPQVNYMIACRELDGNPDELVDQILSADRFCSRIRGKVLQVCFSLDPQTAWKWFQLPRETREAIEQRLDVIIALKRWDRIGIKQRLQIDAPSGTEIIVSDRLLNRIMEVTGGWGFLLDEFLSKWKDTELNPVLDEFRKNLLTEDSSVRTSFLRTLSIHDRIPRQVSDTLKRDDLQDMLKEDDPYDVLSLALEDLPVQQIEATIEYLKRMALIVAEPHLTLEPVVSKLWHDS